MLLSKETDMLHSILRPIWIALFCCIGALHAEWTLPVDLTPLSLYQVTDTKVVVDPYGNATAGWVAYDGSSVNIWAAYKPKGEQWQPPVQVSTGGEYNASLCLLVDGEGTVTAIWRSYTDPNEVIQSSSRPLGGEWQPAETIPCSVAYPRDLTAGIDGGGTITLVWTGYVADNDFVFAATRPKGGPWGSEVGLMTDTGYYISSSRVAVNEAGIAIAIWSAIQEDNYLIQSSTKMIDGTWQSIETIPETLQYPSQPSIVIDSLGTATAVWAAFNGVDAYFVRTGTKPLNGSWGSISSISNPSKYLFDISMVIDSFGNLTTVWRSYNGSERTYRTSDKNSGSTWQPEINFPGIGTKADSLILIVDGAGNATALWSEFDQDSFVLRTSTKPRGESWQETPTTISLPGRDAEDASIAAGPDGYLTAVWMSSTLHLSCVQTANTFPPHSISAISPNKGKPQGGNSVTITGLNFLEVTGVLFGSSHALSFIVNSPTSITAVVPPGSLGTVDVSVIIGGVPSPITAQAHYTYRSKPPRPPKHCTGSFTKKRLPSHHKYLLKAKWKGMKSSNIEYFRIYKKSKVVGTISPKLGFQFTAALRHKHSYKKFRIAAVNADDVESARRRVHLKH